MVSALRPGVTEYTTPSDTQVVITRVVEGPRQAVFDAFTKPEIIRKWMIGPPDWSMPVCEFDARPGGKYKYVYQKGDGSEMTLTGEIREVVPPSRLVSTESWGGSWAETVNVMELTESAGLTTIVLTLNYPSLQARDAALQTGMKEGMDQGFAALDKLLKALA